MKAALKLPFPYISRLVECLSTYKAAFQGMSDAVWLREKFGTVQAKYSPTPGHVLRSCLTACRSSWDKVACVYRSLCLSLSVGDVIDRTNSAVSTEACARVSVTVPLLSLSCM